MLKDDCARPFRKLRAERIGSVRRDDRNADLDVEGVGEIEKQRQRGCRRYGVVVAPPEAGDAAGVRPEIELTRQIVKIERH